MSKFDQKDRQITALLQESATQSNAEIANRIGGSEETIRRRIKRLVKEGYIKVVVVADPAKFGFKVQAEIHVETSPNRMSEIAEAMAKLKETTLVCITGGRFNISAWAIVEDREALRSLLKSIGDIDGVERIETAVPLEVTKQDHRLNIDFER